MSAKFKFTKNNKKAFDQIREGLAKNTTAACMVVQGQAKMLTKVGNSGELRDTINHQITVENDKIVGKVGSPLMYAPYVEFGTGEFAENGQGRKGGWAYKTPDGKWHFTKGMKPQPFLRPAFRQTKKQVQSILATPIPGLDKK